MRRPQATVTFLPEAVGCMPRVRDPRLATVIETKLLEMIRGLEVLREFATNMLAFVRVEHPCTGVRTGAGVYVLSARLSPAAVADRRVLR